MQNKLINLLAHQVSYPLGLAHEIGIEEAIAVSQIIHLGGSVTKDDISQRLIKLAVLKPEQVLARLNAIGVIYIDGLIKLKEEYFQEIDDLQVEVKSSIWQDKEFLLLLNKWKLILMAKAVRKSEKDFTAMFEGKDSDSVKQALQYSIDNRLTTLYYRENNRGHAKTDSFNRRGGTNGGAGSGVSSKSEGDSQTSRAIHKGLESLDG